MAKPRCRCRVRPHRRASFGHGGLLDGSVSGLDQAISYNLAEVADHVTIIPGGFSNSVMVFAMSKSAWDQLDPAQQEAVTKLSGEPLARALGATFAPRNGAAVEAVEKQGGTVLVADDAFVAEITKAAAPFEASVLEAAEKNGLENPESVMSWYRDQIATLSKETN